MEHELCIEKNLGPVDRIVHMVVGAGLVFFPTHLAWNPWIIAIAAAVGGAGILEGIIGY